VLEAQDPDKDLVEVPLVPGPWSAVAQAIGEALAELLAPAPHGLVGADNAPLSEMQLNIPQTETEHMIQPDSMVDDLGGKAMAVVRVGWWLHAVTVAHLQPD
jgi:hypothetical protein